MKINHYILISCVSAMLASCNLLGSIDDIEPENVLTDENAITDANSAEMECAGIYGVWRSFNFASMRAPMFCLTGSLLDNSISGGDDFVTNELTDDNNAVKNYYISLYNVINHANSFIANLTNADPAGLSKKRKAEMLGEAYFNKAYAELALLRSFGEFWDLESDYGIVIHNEPVRDNIAKARSTVSECYTQILADLKNADNAPEYTGISYHANKLSVKALKARVLLSMGNFEEAARTADEVIAEGAMQGLMLEENYLSIYEQGFTSPELLFSLYASYPSQIVESSASDEYNMYGWEKETPIVQVADELVGEANDGDLATGEGYDPRFAAAFSIYEMPFYGMIITVHSMNKYQFSDYNDPSDTYYMMRLAEVYLIKAEANARIGTPSALSASREALKAITDRAGYDEDYVNRIADNELLTMIFKHKYIELSAENYEEWFDMVRYHILDNMDITRYTANDHYLLMPIPREAIAGNNLLIQNRVYASQSAE